MGQAQSLLSTLVLPLRKSFSMPRPLRIQYESACYHLMSRGDRREAIFADDSDRAQFIETLGQTCAKTPGRGISDERAKPSNEKELSYRWGELRIEKAPVGVVLENGLALSLNL